jgi:hypothetical protein
MGGCHQHPLENFSGVAEGSFTAAPDGYPAHYQIELTVTNSAGFTRTTTVQVDAIGTELSLETRPPGMQLIYAGAPIATPQQVTEVDGDTVTIEAPARQDHDGASYLFTGWSDGGDRAHVLTVPDERRTYVAIYEVDTDRDGVVDSMDPCPTAPDRTCTAHGSGEGHGGCVAGGTDPGTGALAALAFALLVGIRAAHRVRRLPAIRSTATTPKRRAPSARTRDGVPAVARVVALELGGERDVEVRRRDALDLDSSIDGGSWRRLSAAVLAAQSSQARSSRTISVPWPPGSSTHLPLPPARGGCQ